MILQKQKTDNGYKCIVPAPVDSRLIICISMCLILMRTNRK